MHVCMCDYKSEEDNHSRIDYLRHAEDITIYYNRMDNYVCFVDGVQECAKIYLIQSVINDSIFFICDDSVHFNLYVLVHR